MNKTSQKGFTLVELLIVIAVIAILATTAILVLNPAEILKKARDTQRIGDLDAISGSLNLLLANGGSLTTTGATCVYYKAAADTVMSANCGGRNSGKTSTSNAIRLADGTGWVNSNLTAQGLQNLPIDPLTATGADSKYAYVSDGTNYELSAVLESSANDSRESSDGGNSATSYEVGSGISSF